MNLFSLRNGVKITLTEISHPKSLCKGMYLITHIKRTLTVNVTDIHVSLILRYKD